MNIKVDFDNIVVKEDKTDTLVKVLMLKGEKGEQGDGEPNVIETIQVNGTALPVTNKTVNVQVPTVDNAISSSSTNPVQNKAIYNALNNKVDTSALSNYYEVSEVDGLLNNKADISLVEKKLYYFDNVASMKAYNLEVGDYAITKGYYNPEDGGQGKYIIVNDANLVNDNGSIHSLTNGLKAKLIAENEVDVKTFGAKGDGITDDTTAIQNAINYCNNLIISSGTYLCNVSITKSNISIKGKNAILKSKSSATSPIINIYGVQNSYLNNVEIINLDFDGNLQNQSSSSAHGITYNYVNNINLDTINMVNIYRCCLFFSNATNVNVNNYKTYGCGDPNSETGCVISEMHNVENANFNNVIVDTFHGEGFLIRKSKNIKVNNFKCSNGSKSGNDAFTTDDCYNISLINFEIDNINHQGIEINSTEKYTIENGKITNCYRNGLLVSTYSTTQAKASSFGAINNITLSDNKTGSINDTYDVYLIGANNTEINNIICSNIKLSKDGTNSINSDLIMINNSNITTIILSGGAKDGLTNVLLNNNVITTISNDVYARFKISDKNKFEYSTWLTMAVGETKNIVLPVNQNLHINGIINCISSFTGDPDRQFTAKTLGFTIMGASGTFETTELHKVNGSVVARNVTISKGNNNTLVLTNNTGVQLYVSLTIDATVY